jgi:hypothetical protein
LRKKTTLSRKAARTSPCEARSSRAHLAAAAGAGASAIEAQVRPRFLPQPFDDVAPPGDVAAGADAERVGEAACGDVDLAGDAEVLGRAAPAFAEDANALRAVDDHRRLVLARERDDGAQVGDGAVQGEDAVGDDNAKARRPRAP